MLRGEGHAMRRREFLRRAGLGMAALAAAPDQARQPRADAGEAWRPNIVLIMADDLGYGHLGCYGQKSIRTPHLDRLARDGMRFTQAYAGCSQCAPTRSVLMTGYHAGHTPVRGNGGGIPLRDEDVTLAEVLREAGYATGLFGKWGLGEATTAGVPNRQGFDEFFGYLHQKHAHFYYTDYLWHNGERHPLPGNRDGKREQYSHDVILDRALAFLGERRDRPFFCFLSLTIPHHEWTAPEETLREYAGAFEENPPAFRWREGYAFPAEPKATMAAMITHMDKGVGRVLHQLEQCGLSGNTLVIFTSDNGADSYSLASPEFFKANGPLRGYKYDLYEGGIRVPAIARWPGRIAPGRESGHVWYAPDLMPTFAELAGNPDGVPKDTDGLSIVPALLGEAGAGRAQPEHPFLYWETQAGSRATRMGDWKAVLPNPDARVELYDLSADPGETHDVAGGHASLVAEMRAHMEASHVEPPPQTEPGAPDGRQYF